MTLTAMEVLNMRFSRAGIGMRGYSESDVDSFMIKVASALEGETPMTAEQVHDVSFGRPPIGKRGYDQGEVDAYLRQIESTLASRDGWTPHTRSAFVAPALEHSHHREPLWRRMRGMVQRDRDSVTYPGLVK